MKHRYSKEYGIGCDGLRIRFDVRIFGVSDVIDEKEKRALLWALEDFRKSIIEEEE